MQWSLSTKTLQMGELGIDTTLNKIKAGNGLSSWSALPWITVSSNDLTTQASTTLTAANEYTDEAIAGLGNTLPETYVPISDVGNPEGVASLDINGKVPDSEIPDSIARDSEIITSYNDLTDKPNIRLGAVKWTANHYLLPGGENTRYLAGDIVWDGGNIYVANYDNESLPTNNTLYWTNIGSGNRLNIDGRDIPNILWDNILEKPTIPSLTGYATETYVNTAVSNLVDTAPETLNTLNELAAAINDDASYASTITTALGLKAPLASPAFTGKIDVNGTATSYLEAAHDGHTGSIDLQNTGIYLYTVSDDNLDSASISAEQGILTFGTNYGEIYYDNLGLQIGMNGADSVNRLEVLGNTINPLTVNGNTTAFAGTVNFGSSTISNLSYSSLSIPVYNAISDLPAAADNHGRWAHVHGEGAMYFAHGGAWYRALSQTDLYFSTNAQSSGYTVQLSDLDKMIEMSGGGTLTITDSSSFPVGFTVDVLQTGSSQVTIAGNGFTPNATPGLKLRSQWSSATLIKRGLNSWVVIGDLSA